MIKLSDRLQMIASLIETGETVADIGTDHGFLPVFLWESKKSPKVILADISKGSLQKAIDNVHTEVDDEQAIEEAFSFRLGDGIQILEDREVNTVVIAGMGGILMTEILGENLNKTRSFEKIILQPRNGQGKLRWWLLNNGFNIKNELLVEEGKFICEIICAESVKNELKLMKLPKDEEIDLKRESESIKYELPESILISNGSLAVKFTEKKLKTEQGILKNMKRASKPDEEKIRQSAVRIEYLRELLEK